MRRNPEAIKELTCALLRRFARGIKFIFRQFTLVITRPKRSRKPFQTSAQRSIRQAVGISLLDQNFFSLEIKFVFMKPLEYCPCFQGGLIFFRLRCAARHEKRIDRERVYIHSCCQGNRGHKVKATCMTTNTSLCLNEFNFILSRAKNFLVFRYQKKIMCNGFKHPGVLHASE